MFGKKRYLISLKVASEFKHHWRDFCKICLSLFSAGKEADQRNRTFFSESGSYSECLGKLLEYIDAGTKETAPREAEELSMFPVSRRGTVYLVFWEVLQVQGWALN